MAIQSFACNVTEALFNRERAGRFAGIQLVARRKLEQLEWAAGLQDLLCLDQGWPARGRDRGLPLKQVNAMAKKLPPIHPGEVLKEDFLTPLGISNYRLAKEIGVPAQRIGEIVAGRRGISADTDLRLCRFFGLSEGYWLRGQARYDTECAKDSIGNDLEKIRPFTPEQAA
jgi:addiction module HigA family antidote